MDDEKPIKSKRVRSSSYPAINLEKAIQGVQKIKNNLGKTPFSRESAAKALGYSGISGISATTVAALVQYGLLTRKANTYTVSTLSDEILTYRDEAEKQVAIAKAAQQPTLYSNLIKAYNGRGLPAMLSHILVRDYGIGERVAEDVVQTFLASMKFAGFLNNGVLTTPNNPPSDNVSGSENREADRSDAMSHKREDEPLKSSVVNSMLHIDVIPGVVLYYRSDLAFDLFTAEKFPKALKDLKAALQDLSKTAPDSIDGAEDKKDEPA